MWANDNAFTAEFALAWQTPGWRRSMKQACPIQCTWQRRCFSMDVRCMSRMMVVMQSISSEFSAAQKLISAPSMSCATSKRLKILPAEKPLLAHLDPRSDVPLSYQTICCEPRLSNHFDPSSLPLPCLLLLMLLQLLGSSRRHCMDRPFDTRR